MKVVLTKSFDYIEEISVLQLVGKSESCLVVLDLASEQPVVAKVFCKILLLKPASPPTKGVGWYS